MNWYDDVILPKVWFEVIRRWWDEKVPTDYPTDTGVEFSFDFGDNKDAVTEMEASLDTDEPVVAPFVPKNTYIQEYMGVFEAEGEGGEQILLSPKRINANSAIAIHYNSETETWENVENVNVVNGYAYGDIATLSPVAVFAIRDEIEYIADLAGLKVLVAKGNPLKLYTDSEENKIYAMNQSSGYKIDITSISPLFVYGGTCDGSDVETTSVVVDGVVSDKLRVYAGSVGTDEKVPNVGFAKATIINSTINGVSGSYYKARTRKLEINIKDSEIKNHIGAGQSMYHGSRNVDGNKEPLNDLSDFITYESEINLDNVKTLIFYTGGTSGLTYTKKAVSNVKNSELGWADCGSSNGLIDDVTMNLTDTKCTVINTANRGHIGSASVTLENVSATDGIYIAGDSTDATVNGTVGEVRYDIGKGGSGTLFLGTNGGVELKDNAIVKSVKYSRSATIVIDDKVKKVLGEKLKMK